MLPLLLKRFQATGLSKKSSPPRQAEASSLPKRPVIVQNGRRPFGPSHSWEEMEAPSDPGISSECERFLELHQTETGAFACPSKIEESKRWDEKSTCSYRRDRKTQQMDHTQFLQGPNPD